VITQFPEQESNFIRSPSPHGVSPEICQYFLFSWALLIHRTGILSVHL
jgi:hypothetical protein